LRSDLKGLTHWEKKKSFMKRNYSPLGITLLVVIGCAFCFARAMADGTIKLDKGVLLITGTTSQHGLVELNILSQTPDGEFQGVLTMLGNTYTVTGEMDANGNFEFRSRRGRTGVRGEGKWKDLTRGGALIHASFRLDSGDRGEMYFLQTFTQPPDPGPPDISGSWHGTFEDVLSLMRGTDELMIQQDRTPNGAPGTGFMGQETRDTIIYDLVGTIDTQRNFARIGVSARGFIMSGGAVESDELKVITVGLSETAGGGDVDYTEFVAWRRQ
jgi:hypothetical protein